MATKKVYDLAVRVSEYTDREGKTKGRYQNVGAVLEKDDGGKFIMLAKWFNPAGVMDGKGGESILLSMFPPRENDGGGEQRASRPPAGSVADKAQKMLGGSAPVNNDDIPF